MSAKVQEIREEIRFLKRAVAEKNHIMRQNDHLRQELRPIKENSKQLQARVTRLCHKLVNEGLGISKKERAFQSSQIAQRIDGISAALVYDTSPVPSPHHSPMHSANNSACSSPIAMRSPKGRSPGRRQSDSSIRSEHSALSVRSGGSPKHAHLHLGQAAPAGLQLPRASTAQSTASGDLPMGLSSYEELLSEQLNPEVIWMAPAATGTGTHSAHHILAPATRKYATDGNIIRQKLRELQHMQKADANSVSQQELELRRAHYESTAKISFSMLNC